jgi:hypothetical protein
MFARTITADDAFMFIMPTRRAHISCYRYLPCACLINYSRAHASALSLLTLRNYFQTAPT